MNVEIKHFYFINDDYFAFANDPLLMTNKDDGENGPCFSAVKESDGIIGMVPVTSKSEKFTNIL